MHYWQKLGENASMNTTDITEISRMDGQPNSNGGKGIKSQSENKGTTRNQKSLKYSTTHD